VARGSENDSGFDQLARTCARSSSRRGSGCSQWSAGAISRVATHYRRRTPEDLADTAADAPWEVPEGMNPDLSPRPIERSGGAALAVIR
jgi:hypothetical protein